MDIVIISEFCDNFSLTDNDRFLYLAKMLANDNDVEIITSTFCHTTKSSRNKPIAKWPFKISFIKEPGYSKNVCLKRFLSHYIWGRNVNRYLKKRKKPDVIYCAVPSLTGPYLVAKYSKRNNVKFVIDVQDLWPEAFRMIINLPVISNILFTPFSILANGIYKRADAICAVSDTYVNRALMVNPKCTEGTTVFLGTNLKTFDTYSTETPVLVKQEDEIWIGYAGTLGNSYDLTCVIDALSILNRPNIKFIVMGDGPKQTEFEHFANEKGVKTIFTGRLKYDQMCSLLCSCDINVNPISHRAAQSIINKHADYAASGIPVISTQENSEYRSLIERYHMGFNCRNSDAEDLANKITKLLEDKQLRCEMGINARKCAKEQFDREQTYQRLTNIILD